MFASWMLVNLIACFLCGFFLSVQVRILNKCVMIHNEFIQFFFSTSHCTAMPLPFTIFAKICFAYVRFVVTPAI